VRRGESNVRKTMSVQRATAFGDAWNSRDPDLVASFFARDGIHHASVGPDHLGTSYYGKGEIRGGAQAFFDRYPDGRFENVRILVAGNIGALEWDFVATDSMGVLVRTAGCGLLEFKGDMVMRSNAFRKARG